MNHWTFPWMEREWEIIRQYQPYELLDASGSNNYLKRGDEPGDVVYIVGFDRGSLMLGGRIIVERIVDRDEAVRVTGNDNLLDRTDWIIGKGSPFAPDRRLSPEVSKKFEYLSTKSGRVRLKFDSASRLDTQTLRGVRRLTPESAELLDRIIKITDRLPRPRRNLTVTEKLLTGSLSSLRKRAKQ